MVVMRRLEELRYLLIHLLERMGLREVLVRMDIHMVKLGVEEVGVVLVLLVEMLLVMLRLIPQEMAVLVERLI